MALKFFIGLPLEACTILLQIKTLASADDLEKLNREITYAHLDIAKYSTQNCASVDDESDER